MKRMTRGVLLALLLTALIVATAHAATYTAVSCNRSDVNAVINGPTHIAVDGDTIIIPAGSCTWTAGVTVPKGIGISIIGSGTPYSTPAPNGASSSCANTTITDSGAGFLFSMSPTYGNSTSRLSCMTLVPSGSPGSPISVKGTCASGGCPNLRLDNIIAPSSWGSVTIPDQTFGVIANMFGVADHNSIGDSSPPSIYINFVNVGHGGWKGVGGWGDNSWADGDTFGTDQQFYIENNVFSHTIITDSDIGDSSGGGARFTCRFNSLPVLHPFGACTGHGTDTTGRPRGARQVETYYNTATCTDASQGCGSLTVGRSAVQMTFSNTITNSGGGFFKGITDLSAQRTWRADAPWGGCNGTSPWDVNDGVTYYTGTVGAVSGLGTGDWTITALGSPGWTTNQWAPRGAPYLFYDVTKAYGIFIDANTSNALSLVFLCDSCISFTPSVGDTFTIYRSTVCIDQPNRGAGLLVTGTTPVLVATGGPGSVNQALDPSYEAANAMPSTADHTITSGQGHMILNRDFYAESPRQAAQTSPTSPFNGTTGTGHGTLANRPTTCTPRVGYWATDQGTWNQSGTGGQGQLYVCTATNTWTLYYTPYTYPHPLTQGSPGTPAAPTNLQLAPQ